MIIPVRDYLMVHSKICSTVTYYRGLRELREYGYIDYRPSYAAGRTRIVLIESVGIFCENEIVRNGNSKCGGDPGDRMGETYGWANWNY